MPFSGHLGARQDLAGDLEIPACFRVMAGKSRVYRKVSEIGKLFDSDKSLANVIRQISSRLRDRPECHSKFAFVCVPLIGFQDREEIGLGVRFRLVSYDDRRTIVKRLPGGDEGR